MRALPAFVRTPSRPVSLARLAFIVALFVVVAAAPASGRSSVARADETASGLLVTVSATSEEAAGDNGGALLVQIALDNRGGPSLAGLTVSAAIPAQTHVVDSWLGQPGQGEGALDGSSITWSGGTISDGGHLGPFAYRIAPDAGADGAGIFQQASVQPTVTWSQPSAGFARGQQLDLNGLWGETNLRRTVLPTGLTIFTQERPDTATVALRATARAGSRDEDESTCGGSHWLEHAHFLGTVRRPNNQAVSRDIDVAGGEFNASTAWESTTYWNLMPADKFDVGLDVLSDQLLNSTFPPAAFEREKQVVIQEIKLRQDSASTHAFDLFLSEVFQTSPLRQSPAATICLLSLPIDTILSYRAQHYVTGNMYIAASGRLHHDEAVAKIAQAFAALPVGPHFARSPIPEPVEQEPRRIQDGSGTGPTEIRIGWPAPGANDADWPAMVILSDILGDVGRRLTQTARDNSIVITGVGASYLDFSDAGALMLSATVPSDQIDRLTGLYLDQVKRLRDGDLSDADVQASFHATAGSRALDQELNLAQTQRASDAASGTLESYDEALARLQTVTAADVQRVALKYLDPANYSLVILQQ